MKSIQAIGDGEGFPSWSIAKSSQLSIVSHTKSRDGNVSEQLVDTVLAPA